MKAVIYTKYGSYKELILKEMEKPVPKANEVLVKIHAVSINDWDWGLLIGAPFINRLGNGIFKPKKIQILGSDIAGVIEDVGSEVKHLKPGDNVYGDLSGTWGGFAEYVCTRENNVSLKPDIMNFEEAAALPQAGMLAVQGLIDQGKIKTGQNVLINGAGGGVGTLGIQIAKTLGCEVTGVDSSDKFEMMNNLGFDHLIDYRKIDFTKSKIQYDLILDNKTYYSFFKILKVLKPKGTYVTTGGSIPKVLLTLIMSPLIKIIFNKKIRIVALNPNKDLKYMNDLFEEGKMKPVIDGTYKLNDIPKAMKYFGEGKHKGKLVISVI